MERPLMKCRHTATGTLQREGVGVPVCVSCGVTEISEVTPDLENRIATCSYGCGSSSKSKLSLAFFEHLPDRETDRYYCGCYGWD